MNSINSNFKKIISVIAVIGLFFGPTGVIFSQTDSDWTSGVTAGDSSSYLVDDNSWTSGVTAGDSSSRLISSNESNADLTLSSRTSKDSQANQKEAAAIEQAQKSDEDECNKQSSLSGATNAISQAVQPAMQQAVQSTIEQSIESAIPSVIESGIRSSIPSVIKSSIQSQLPTLIKSQLPINLESRLTLEKTAGTDLTNKSILSSIVQDELKKVINSGIPSILSKSLSNNLPSELSQYLQDNLISSITANISTNLSSNIQTAISSTLSNSDLSSQIDSSLREALEQSGSNLSEQIISSIDSSAMNQITSQLTSALNESMGSITSAITSGLTENLGNTFDSIGESLASNITNTITSNITGQLDSAINQITSSLTSPIDQAINSITGQISGTINGMMDTIMSPINNMMGTMMDTIMSPINNMMGTMMDTIMSPVTNILNSVTGTIADTVSQTIGNTVSSVVGGTIGSSITSTLGSSLGGIVGGVAGGVVGGLIGGGYVPVKEQNGPLLKATKNIDTTTGDIKKLTVEICKHTKAIRRIQQAFEEKEFVNDPEATREARTQTEKYRQAMDKFLDSGFDSSGAGADSSMYPKNTADYIDEVREEQFNVFQTQIKGLDSDYIDDIRLNLEKYNSASDLDVLKPTLTTENKNKLLNDPSSMESDDFYDSLIKYGDLRNNAGSILIAKDILAQRQDLAEQNAREELQAGSGYLPTRKCTEKVGDYCVKYETVTPAITVKDASSKAMNARVDEYINAKEASDIASGNEPQITEIVNMQPSTGGGGGSSGWSNNGSSGSGFDLSSLVNLLTNSSDSSGFDLSSIIGSVADNLTSKPTVSISLTKTSDSAAQVKWTVSGASICKANNDWYSLGNNDETKIIKSSGQFLSLGTNSLKINIPLPPPAIKLTIRQNAFIYEIGSSINISTSGMVKEKIYSLNDDETYEPQAMDIYSLSIGDQSVSYTNNTNSVSTGLAGLKTAVEALSASSDAGKKFSQVKISFNTSAGKIIISTAMNYKIKCTGLTGSTEAQTSS